MKDDRYCIAKFQLAMSHVELVMLAKQYAGAVPVDVLRAIEAAAGRLVRWHPAGVWPKCEDRLESEASFNLRQQRLVNDLLNRVHHRESARSRYERQKRQSERAHKRAAKAA